MNDFTGSSIINNTNFNNNKRFSEMLNPSSNTDSSNLPRLSVYSTNQGSISFNKYQDDINIRPKYSEKFMRENFSFTKGKKNDFFRDTIHYIKKNYRPSPLCAKNYFLKRIPFFHWIFKYNVRECFLKDLVAGLTVGIIHIPQSMAYALMAGVPAINGLYLAFFAVLLYVFFGTSRHISTG